MADVMKDLKEMLDEHNIPYKRTETGLAYLPDSNNGFNVTLEEDAAFFTLFYAGYHEHYMKKEINENKVKEIIYAFFLGLSDMCRVKVFRSGTRDCKWIVEMLCADKWVFGGFLTTMPLFSWRKTDVRYLQNNLFSVCDIENIFPINEISVDLSPLISLKCVDCGNNVKTCVFNFKDAVILCGSCNKPIKTDAVINNSTVDCWYSLLPRQKRDDFLTRLGFTQKPVVRSSRFVLIFGLAIMGVMPITLGLIAPMPIGPKLLLVGLGIVFIVIVRSNYNKETIPAWKKKPQSRS
jgi:hypothetical protein